MADIKKTKTEYFVEIKEIINAAPIDEAVREDINTFIDKQIEILAKKAESSKVRQAARKAESDALTDTIYGLLTSEPQTIPQILTALDEEDLTRAKVAARLSRLVRDGQATKEKARVDGATVTVYTKIEIE